MLGRKPTRRTRSEHTQGNWEREGEERRGEERKERESGGARGEREGGKEKGERDRGTNGLPQPISEGTCVYPKMH